MAAAAAAAARLEAGPERVEAAEEGVVEQEASDRQLRD